jgi:hypothetical protein
MALADEREVPRRLAAVVIVLAAAASARVLDDQELLVVLLDRERRVEGSCVTSSIIQGIQPFSLL